MKRNGQMVIADFWYRTQLSPALIRISGGYGGGWAILMPDEWRMITRKLINCRLVKSSSHLLLSVRV